jgi:small subunit ribosomal protein S17
MSEETENTEETTETPVSDTDTPVAEEAPVSNTEPVSDTEMPVAVAEEAAAPAAEEPAAPPAAEEPAALPAQSGPKKKRKHLPRAERPKKGRRVHVPAAERKPIVRLPKPEHDRGRSQERRGVVVSSAMDKTIVVKVDVIKQHPRYKKVVRRSVKFHAHDEQNSANVGDVVRIVETRPLSATKRWRLAEIVEAAK